MKISNKKNKQINYLLFLKINFFVCWTILVSVAICSTLFVFRFIKFPPQSFTFYELKYHEEIKTLAYAYSLIIFLIFTGLYYLIANLLIAFKILNFFQINKNFCWLGYANLFLFPIFSFLLMYFLIKNEKQIKLYLKTF